MEEAPPPHKHRRVEELTRRIHATQRELLACTQEIYPLGARVLYRHGRMARAAEGEVVDHSIDFSWPRLRLRGPTGAIQWVRLGAIQKVYDDEAGEANG